MLRSRRRRIWRFTSTTHSSDNATTPKQRNGTISDSKITPKKVLSRTYTLRAQQVEIRSITRCRRRLQSGVIGMPRSNNSRIPPGSASYPRRYGRADTASMGTIPHARSGRITCAAQEGLPPP